MAHTFDTSGITAGATSNPVVLSYTPGVGATVLVLCICIESVVARGGGAPTFNGVAMLQAGTTQVTNSTVGSTEIWYMLNPPTGAPLNISVPNSGILAMTIIGSTYKAAAGFTSKLDAVNGVSSTGVGSANPTVSVVTTVNGDAIVSAVIHSGGALTQGQTLLFTGVGVVNKYGSEYALQSSLGSITMGWTATTGRWATNVASFSEIAIATNKNQLMMMGTGT